MKKALFIVSIFIFSINVSFCQTIQGSYDDTLRLQSALSPSTEIFNLESKPTFAKMFGKSFLNVCTYNIVISGSLLLMPESISKWDANTKLNLHHIANQYRLTYTKPPIMDCDLWVVNYFGHPCQGSFYYNSVRSQGATIFQSALASTLHTLIWEYGWEGGMEQPSVQDLLVTPIFFFFLGEFSHQATFKMKKNGFRWYEKIITCIVNPNYVLNNGLNSK